MIKPKPKLCITAPWVYPLFNPRNTGYFGGWDVRVATIARGLAERGMFDVSIVTGDHGQPHVEHVDQLSLYSWKGREIWGISPDAARGGRMRRLFRRIRSRVMPERATGEVGHYRIYPGMLKIYDEIDADVYTVPGNSQFSGELAFHCQRRGRPYAFLAGSDFDLYPEYRMEPDKLDMYGVPYALKAYTIESASAHVLQNEHQARLLRDGYGISGRVIRNPINLTLTFPRAEEPSGILWVGKSDERVKRPSLLFELARAMPETPFTVIMNRGLPDTHTACLAIAAGLPNVTFIERVPFDEIERYYAAASLFVSTSVFEGFPNTFLQAAKYGVPIVASTVDPGGMLSTHGCGVSCGGDSRQFVSTVRQMMVETESLSRCGAAALRYVRAYHDERKVVAEYEAVFGDLTGHLR